ncbi:MAG: hypothetical protein ACLS37_13615 [Alistipes sp.]
MDGARTLYSLMVVLSTGEDQVLLPDGKQASSPFFIGALIEGDEPHDGELLDFVRLTSLTDERRSGALYLTASDGESPYMDVIDGMGTERSSAVLHCRVRLSRQRSMDVPLHPVGRWSRTDHTPYPHRCFGNDRGGLQIPFTVPVGHPSVWSSRSYPGIEGSGVCTATLRVCRRWRRTAATRWMSLPQQYRLSLITVDFPAEYLRVLTFDLAAYLSVGDWCEISDLNVCLLEHLSSFRRLEYVWGVSRVFPIRFSVCCRLQGLFPAALCHARCECGGDTYRRRRGRVRGTFYVGRIHKNCFVNSLEPAFYPAASVVTEPSPAGIGVCHRITADNVRIDCQSEAWTEAHAGQLYCFSFWIRREIATTLRVQYGTTLPQDLTIGREWTRHILF